MSVEVKLRQRVVASVPSINGRVYRDVLPLYAILPAVVYQWLPGGEMWNAHDHEPPKAGASRVQWTCWAGNGAQVDQLAGDVIQALGGWRDQSPPRIDGVLVLSPPAGNYEPDSQVHRRIVDTRVLHATSGEDGS